MTLRMYSSIIAVVCFLLASASTVQGSYLPHAEIATRSHRYFGNHNHYYQPTEGGEPSTLEKLKQDLARIYDDLTSLTFDDISSVTAQEARILRDRVMRALRTLAGTASTIQRQESLPLTPLAPISTRSHRYFGNHNHFYKPTEGEEISTLDKLKQELARIYEELTSLTLDDISSTTAQEARILKDRVKRAFRILAGY